MDEVGAELAGRRWHTIDDTRVTPDGQVALIIAGLARSRRSLRWRGAKEMLLKPRVGSGLHRGESVMRPLRLLSAVCVIAPLFALVSSPTRAAAQDSAAVAPAPAKKPPKGRANLITEEEIAFLGGTVQTAYGIVQRLRPAMLRVRSGNSSSSSSSGTDVGSNDIMVYLDNQKLAGGVRALEEITLSQIKEIKYLSASDATTLFGTGNAAGAIQIIGKR